MSLVIQHNFDALVAALSQARGQTLTQADRAMHRGALVFERSAKLNAPAFQSVLKNSIHANRKADFHYEINSGQAYAAAKELGTQPGYWPDSTPSSDFYKWVRSISGASGSEADRAAYLIARSIHRKGTKAHEFFKRAFDTHQAGVFARVAKAAGAGLQA